MVACKNCGNTDPPIPPNNRCKCGCARVGNNMAITHGARAKLTASDFAARDALMDKLFHERGGRSSLDIVTQLRIEDYATAQIQLANVTRRLEELGAVSTAGNKRKSLVDAYDTFSARSERLAEKLPPALPIAESASMFPGRYDMPTPALNLAIELLERQVAGEQLSDRELGKLDLLLAAARGELTLPPEPAEAGAGSEKPGNPEEAGSLGRSLPAVPGQSSGCQLEPEPARPESEPEVEPEPRCLYCHQLAEKCHEIKATRLGDWRLLHHFDPAEIERRSDEATATMLAMMGKRSPWL